MRADATAPPIKPFAPVTKTRIFNFPRCGGPSLPGMYRRAADYVDRLARGAKAAELPIEQPTNFELILDLKTAKAIGVTLPTSIVLRRQR